MKNVFKLAMVADVAMGLVVGTPAFGASNDMVTAWMTDKANYPNAVFFVTATDGWYNSATRQFSGDVQCYSMRDSGALPAIMAMSASQGAGLSPYSGLPFMPFSFNVGVPSPVPAGLYPGDCPALLYGTLPVSYTTNQAVGLGQ